MKKICYATISFIATTLLCTDFIYKLQVSSFPEYLSTIFIVILLGLIIKFMVEVNIAYFKRGKGILFRPPFFKPIYFQDYEKYQWQRAGAYSIFFLIIGILFYLSKSNMQNTIPEIIEVLAIAFMVYSLMWGMYENQVKRCIRIANGDLSKEPETL